MATLIMVRTECCESYKCTGTRCLVCPNRPENREIVEQCRRESEMISLRTVPAWTSEATPVAG